MDDYQIIIYLVIAAIAFISRLAKSNKGKSAPPASQSQPSQQPKKGKELTFEELLKEFTDDDEPPVQQAQPTRSVEPVRPVEVKRVDPLTLDDDEIQRAYQRSVKEASSISSPSSTRTSMEDRHTGKFDHFDAYDDFEEEEEENEIMTLLRSADGPKKAVILSEILNRKY